MSFIAACGTPYGMLSDHPHYAIGASASIGPLPLDDCSLQDLTIDLWVQQRRANAAVPDPMLPNQGAPAPINDCQRSAAERVGNQFARERSPVYPPHGVTSPVDGFPSQPDCSAIARRFPDAPATPRFMMAPIHSSVASR